MPAPDVPAAESPERIPVTLVTGFLGSGKTTLIGHLLRQDGFAGTLVVVNEFGEAGIDHDLLEASSDDTILLANGCLCCTIRGNLVDTLLDVLAQRESGRLRVFDRVIVETSGIADPAPVLAFLMSDRRVMARYRLGAVVTTCDAVAGFETLVRQPEAASQVRLADRLLVTKTDLAPADGVALLDRRLRALNPLAPIHHVVPGAVDAAWFLDPWAEAKGAQATAYAECCDDPAHHHAHHTDRFTATVLHATRDLTEAEMPALIEAVRAYAGPHLLRLKALLPLAGGRVLIVQAALMTVHDLDIGPALRAPSGRLVLITEGASPGPLVEALAPLGLLSA
ncbi:MAG TPA: GTP-binding protein [Stellaceae bacterium]|nr:GTP-binding protein [Stellaceae bacterium]